MLYDGLGGPYLISFIYKIHSATLIQRWWRNYLFRKIISKRIIQKEIVLR
jgi:hypothetical protein